MDNVISERQLSLEAIVESDAEYKKYYQQDPRISESPYDARPSFEERKLAELPQDASLLWAVLSPDKRSVAVTVRMNGQYSVFINGKKGPDWDGASPPVPYPDGKAFQYTARMGNQWFLVENDTPNGPYDRVSYRGFTADGKTQYYTATKDRKSFLFVGNNKWGPYDSVSVVDVQTEPTTGFKTLAGTEVVAEAYNGGSYEMYLVTRDGVMGPYENLSSVHLEADGKTPCYAYRKGNTSYVVVGGRQQAVRGWVSLGPIPNPSRPGCAYVTREGPEGKVCRLFVDGKLVEGAGDVERLQYSPDGKRLVWVRRESRPEGSRAVVVVDGAPHPSFIQVGHHLCFDAGGKTIAYAAKSVLGEITSEDRHVVVVNAKPSEEFIRLWWIGWGDLGVLPDGRVAYSGQSAREPYRWTTVIGDQRIERDGPSRVEWSPTGKIVLYEAGSPLKPAFAAGSRTYEGKFPSRLAYSPDETRFAGVARGPTGECIIVGDKRSEVSKAVGKPVFSPDGKKVAYGAYKGREIWWKVKDVE